MRDIYFLNQPVYLWFPTETSSFMCGYILPPLTKPESYLSWFTFHPHIPFISRFFCYKSLQHQDPLLTASFFPWLPFSVRIMEELLMVREAMQSYQCGNFWATKERGRWMIEIFYEAPFQVKRLKIVTLSFWETEIERESKKSNTHSFLVLFCVNVTDGRNITGTGKPPWNKNFRGTCLMKWTYKLKELTLCVHWGS